MLEIGECLSGRYRIDRVLGKGGMGAVYLGVMESLGGKKFAIKEMEFVEHGHRTKEQALEQFRKEASFLANLSHPNLVPVTDFFSDRGKHYLVMSYVEGETLQQRIERLQQPLQWSELKSLVEDLLDVLDYLHTQNPPIIFRDLKPSNIMIEPSGHLRLIDFGIARTAMPGQETSTFLKGTGTSGFSPIEQYGMGETTDQRSDIYAFGATVYYLLTGKLPPDAVHRVSAGKPLKPPTTLNPKLPGYLDGILLRCLAVRQDNRYNSVKEIQRELSLVCMVTGPGDTLELNEVADMSLYSSDQRMVPGARDSSLASLLVSVVCLFAVMFVAFNWQGLMESFQPEVALKADSAVQETVGSRPRSRTEEEAPRFPPPPPPPRREVMPEPVTRTREQPVAPSSVEPEQSATRKTSPKPKLDLGGSSYPKAAPRESKQDEPQRTSPHPPPVERMVFYEKRADGTKVPLKPGDPRIPALRRKLRDKYRQQLQR